LYQWNGVEHFVRAKEYYPSYLWLSRTEEESIFEPEKEAGKYEKRRMDYPKL
jgi:hypothetical protein